MKKSILLMTLLSSFLVLSACNTTKAKEETKTDEQQTSESGGGGGETSSSEQQSEGKIKEIAKRETAPSLLHVTERISTSVLYELRPNKGQTLKTADKKVIITSSDPEVLLVEKTDAVVSTFLTALKPGEVKLTIQSNIQPDLKLVLDITVADSVFDRLAQDGFFGNSWENVDFTHEVDEENPYIKTMAEDTINHQFYFRNSYSTKSYTECEFTFYSEQDGSAHMPKLGFAFSTNEINDTDLQSVSMIYFDTDSRGGKDTYYNIGYNEIANGIWGWDQGGTNPLAKSCGLYTYEPGIKKGETFKMGVVKDGYNYHVYLNGTYVKSVATTVEGFSVDKTYTEAAPTISGLFDFKSEVKYSNYLFTTDESVVNSKIPATPDFVGAE